jgi:hypothetical protein
MPLHIQEASYSDWVKWYAWYPVQTEQDEWIWFKHVYTRTLYFPRWFNAAAFVHQYSLIKKDRWHAD